MMRRVARFDRELLNLIKCQTDREKVKTIINEGKLHNVIENSGNTLLHIAAKSNNTVLVQYLIDLGSSVDLKNNSGQTPLILAITYVRDKCVEMLIKAGADIEMQDSEGHSALQLIGECEWSSDEALQNCLRKLQHDYSNNKEEIATKLINAKWLLQNIVKLENADLTRILLQRHYATKINTVTHCSSKTALHVAIKSVDVENVIVLLNYNANVNAMDIHNHTPLFYLYYRAFYFINLRDEDKDLHSNERLAILKMLLDQGAILFGDDPTNRNINCAYDILEYGSKEAIKLFLKTNIDLSLRIGESGDTAIHALARNRNHNAMQHLYGKFLHSNIRNSHGITPLMTAVEYGNPRAVEFFLDKGAVIDVVDYNNITVKFGFFSDDIFSARYEKQYTDCVQILLERNANVQSTVVRGNETLTIFNWILFRKYPSIVRLVISYLSFKEIQGISIIQLIRDEINKEDIFKVHFHFSKQRLQYKIYNSITLFDLLNVSDRKFEFYVRNEELIIKIRDTIRTLTHNYYFQAILQKRLSKAINMIALKIKAGSIICNIMGTSYERFPLIADNIISYLEQKDMNNLIEASL